MYTAISAEISLPRNTLLSGGVREYMNIKSSQNVLCMFWNRQRKLMTTVSGAFDEGTYVSRVYAIKYLWHALNTGQMN